VVFADITGFTTLVDSNDVEKVVEVLNRFFETVVPVIFKHGGMLDKFLGDGVMAVFGIPDESEMDPVMAIRCAVDIQLGVKALKERMLEEGLFPIDVGIGIATGVVVAGNIGTNEQINYTVIGEPVNLAQRLESISQPGEIIVSSLTTEELPEHSGLDVRFEEMGAVRVKGIHRDINPLKVIYQEKNDSEQNLKKTSKI
jgi:adenylate cyclase